MGSETDCLFETYQSLDVDDGGSTSTDLENVQQQQNRMTIRNSFSKSFIRQPSSNNTVLNENDIDVDTTIALFSAAATRSADFQSSSSTSILRNESTEEITPPFDGEMSSTILGDGYVLMREQDADLLESIQLLNQNSITTPLLKPVSSISTIKKPSNETLRNVTNVTLDPIVHQIERIPPLCLSSGETISTRVPSSSTTSLNLNPSGYANLECEVVGEADVSTVLDEQQRDYDIRRRSFRTCDFSTSKHMGSLVSNSESNYPSHEENVEGDHQNDDNGLSAVPTTEVNEDGSSKRLRQTSLRRALSGEVWSSSFFITDNDRKDSCTGQIKVDVIQPIAFGEIDEHKELETVEKAPEQSDERKFKRTESSERRLFEFAQFAEAVGEVLTVDATKSMQIIDDDYDDDDDDDRNIYEDPSDVEATTTSETKFLPSCVLVETNRDSQIDSSLITQQHNINEAITYNPESLILPLYVPLKIEMDENAVSASYSIGDLPEPGHSFRTRPRSMSGLSCRTLLPTLLDVMSSDGLRDDQVSQRSIASNQVSKELLDNTFPEKELASKGTAIRDVPLRTLLPRRYGSNGFLDKLPDNYNSAPETSKQINFVYKGIVSNPPEIVKQGTARGNYAQLHRKAWLEVSDKYHRYGKNLRLYYRFWESLGFPTNSFFDWLDSKGEAEGNALPELPECPRMKLDNDTVLYITNPEITRTYKVDFVGTTAKNDEKIMNAKAQLNNTSQNFSSTSSNIGRSYQQNNQQLSSLRKGLVVDGNGAALKTGPDGWIFVLRDNEMYAAPKITSVGNTSSNQPPQRQQRFHHSSFFGGKAVAAAGIFITDDDGILTRLYPHSGHYRPGEAHMQRVLFYLYHKGIDLRTFEMDIQQILHVAREENADVSNKQQTKVGKTSTIEETTGVSVSDPISENGAESKNEANSNKTSIQMKKKKTESLHLMPALLVACFLAHKARFIGEGIFAQIHKIRKCGDSITNVTEALRVIDNGGFSWSKRQSK